jgi:hypothetical protein
MNLRQLAGIDEPYFQFGREERHLAGILFYLLNHKDNAERAIRSVEPDWRISPAEFGVYLEYSYPRDLWRKMELREDGRNIPRSNDRKRAVIIGMLESQGFDASKLAWLKHAEVTGFNEFFIGESRASHDYVESPANWSLKTTASNLPSNKDLLIACKIKWAFKVKPDLVIHADRQHAVCIELKLESREGSYPSRGDEKELLRKRGFFGEGKGFHLPISQTKLQRFLMTELLGLCCRFRIITRHETRIGDDCLSWRDFLSLLEPLPNPPAYIEAALKIATNPGRFPRPKRENHSAQPVPTAGRVPIIR